MNAYWVGDAEIDEEIYPTFHADATYHVSFKLIFNTDAGYCANYVMSQYGEYIVSPDTFSATVNGIPATITRNNPPYHPTVEVSLKLEGEALSEEEKIKITEEDNIHREVRHKLNPALIHFPFLIVLILVLFLQVRIATVLLYSIAE